MSEFSLLDICYEPITSRFSYGMFGEFKLIIDTHTGYFNASKLCATGHKQFHHWLTNKHSKRFMKVIKDMFQEDVSYQKKGGLGEIDNLIRGTYVSQHLITNIASWISIRFSIKVNKIVSDYFVKEYREKKEIKITQLENQIEKYEKLKEDISLKTNDPTKRQIFVLVMTNGVYPFYAIRCQQKAKRTLIRKLKQKYPNVTEMFQISYDPNSINLFNRVKERNKNITTFCNGIKLLNDYTIQNFEEDVKKIAVEKI